jgi:hypothetical protein
MFTDLISSEIPGAREIRIITLTEDEIFQRAREAFVFAHPGAPLFLRRLARSGRLDWAFADSRQALRDIEKSLDFLTHEARAAWVLNTHAGLMKNMDRATREAVAQITVTAIRLGTKDSARPPHAVISCGSAVLAVVVAVLIAGAIVAAF